MKVKMRIAVAALGLLSLPVLAADLGAPLGKVYDATVKEVASVDLAQLSTKHPVMVSLTMGQCTVTAALAVIDAERAFGTIFGRLETMTCPGEQVQKVYGSAMGNYDPTDKGGIIPVGRQFRIALWDHL